MTNDNATETVTEKAGSDTAEELQARTARTFDAYEGSYSDSVTDSIRFSGLKADFFTRVKADYIKDIAHRHFADPAAVQALDIGCGIGNYHPLLDDFFQSIDGAEVSAASADTARRRNPSVTYSVYDGKTLPYPDESFDLAFTICVMHHVPPPAWPNFVAEMYRVLKPGGLALVFEHNPGNPLTMRAVNNCPFDEDAVLLTRKETADLFRGRGFESLRSGYILTLPAGNRLLRRFDGFFAQLGIGAQYYVAATRP